MTTSILERTTPQQSWGWNVAAYLFLGGLGGGAYVAGFGATLAGAPDVGRVGVVGGLLAVLAGAPFLIADLGVKKPWRVFMRVNRSWLSRGAWIITGFVVGDAVLVAAWVWPGGWLEPHAPGFLALGGVTACFALGLMAYTGLLLRAARGVVAWETRALPALFTASGASTGVMGLVLYGVASSASRAPVDPAVIATLGRVDAALIVVELVMLGVYLRAIGGSVAGAEARELVLSGGLSRAFWAVVVVGGLLVPLGAELAAVTVGFPATALAGAMVLGLVGGLWLRAIVLKAGLVEPVPATTLYRPVAAPPADRRPSSGE